MVQVGAARQRPTRSRGPDQGGPCGPAADSRDDLPRRDWACGDGGALVIGLVALNTLREIKTEAATEAKGAAASQITESMAAGLGHTILSEMARKGELDEVFERVAMRLQSGEPEPDPGEQT